MVIYLIQTKKVGIEMKLSAKSRYGLRVMTLLARKENENKVLSITDISALTRVSKPYLEKVLSILRREGLVTAGRGQAGGYALARGPSQISVGDVLRVLEDELKITRCAVENCSHECANRDVFHNLYVKINDYLDTISLADMARKGESN